MVYGHYQTVGALWKVEGSRARDSPAQGSGQYFLVCRKCRKGHRERGERGKRKRKREQEDGWVYSALPSARTPKIQGVSFVVDSGASGESGYLFLRLSPEPHTTSLG